MSRPNGRDGDVDIDDVDRAILRTLLADGRAGPSDLADAAGVTPSTASKRLDALEESGLIEGYQPVVDYAAVGYDVTALFRLGVEGDGRSVVEDLASTARIVDVYEVTGSDDVVAVGTFPGTAAMNDLVTTLLDHEGVDTVETDVVLDVVCRRDQPPPPSE